jgi:hypothetical protein
MVPDPFVIVICAALGLSAYAVFRMCTYRDLTQIDSREFDDEHRDPQEEARGRRY